MRPTKGQSDDRPRARRPPARVVRRRGRRHRDGTRRPAPGPRHDPGDHADATPLVGPAARLHAAGRGRSPGRRWRAGRGFRDHEPEAGRHPGAERRDRRSQRVAGLRDAGADPEHPSRAIRSPSSGSSTEAEAASAARTCRIPRLFIVGTDGQGAREFVAGGDTSQADPVWSPDGTRLLYWDDGKLYLTDTSGSAPILVDTGCAAPVRAATRRSRSRAMAGASPSSGSDRCVPATSIS